MYETAEKFLGEQPEDLNQKDEDWLRSLGNVYIGIGSNKSKENLDDDFISFIIFILFLPHIKAHCTTHAMHNINS